MAEGNQILTIVFLSAIGTLVFLFVCAEILKYRASHKPKRTIEAVWRDIDSASHDLEKLSIFRSQLRSPQDRIEILQTELMMTKVKCRILRLYGEIRRRSAVPS